MRLQTADNTSMELHSASPAAYAYFDRIEAVAQDQADAMFDGVPTSRASGQPHSTAWQPAEPTVGSGSTPARLSVDWPYLTIVGLTLLLAGGFAVEIARALPTSGAAAVSLSAFAGCSLAVAWPSPDLDTEDAN